MALSERQKDLISMLVNERYTEARSYLPHILAEDKSKKNEAFVAKYLQLLEQKPALPAAYQGVLQGGYPDEEEMKRYYLSDREKAVADTIRRMYRATEKLDKMHIHYVIPPPGDYPCGNRPGLPNLTYRNPRARIRSVLLPYGRRLL